MVEEKKPDAAEPRRSEHGSETKAKFSDTAPPARPQLGKVKTDEEARLAAEIEKLRG
jgi:hypothetical protein